MGDAIKPTQRKDFAGKSTQEVFEILKEEGTELTEEQLEAVAGGSGWEDYGYFFCEKCNHLVEVRKPKTQATCENCGYTFEIQWP